MAGIGKKPKVPGQPKSSRLVIVTDWDPSPERHDYWENLAKRGEVAWLAKQGEVGEDQKGETKGRHIQIAFQGCFSKTKSAWEKFLKVGQPGIKIHDKGVQLMHSDGGLTYTTKDRTAEEDPTIRRRFEWGDRPKSVKIGNIMTEKMIKQKEESESEEEKKNKEKLKEIIEKETKRERECRKKFREENAEEKYREIRDHTEKGECGLCYMCAKITQEYCRLKTLNKWYEVAESFPYDKLDEGEKHVWNDYEYEIWKNECGKRPGTLAWIRWWNNRKNVQYEKDIKGTDWDTGDKKKETN